MLYGAGVSAARCCMSTIQHVSVRSVSLWLHFESVSLVRSSYGSSRSIAPLGELSHVCRALPGTVVATGGSALALAPRCKVQTLDASDMMSHGLSLCVLPVQRLSTVFALPCPVEHWFQQFVFSYYHSTPCFDSQRL
eukprot:UN4684